MKNTKTLKLKLLNGIQPYPIVLFSHVLFDRDKVKMCAVEKGPFNKIMRVSSSVK